jgi:predicted alpha/beta-fold hydrolase
MSWNFALAASRGGAPGYAPEDARDLYEAMQHLLPMLRIQYGTEITGVNFLGASLGALQGASLSVIDAEERKIGIGQFLFVNPPLDLSYAFTKVDEWDAFQNRFGKDKSKKLVAKALQFLIAEDLQALLPELVYVTQAIDDQNVLKAPKDQARKRRQEAKALTFSDYSEKIAVPLWRLQAAEPQADSESFWKRESLAPILGRLRGYLPVQLMHNADDFIARRKSIQELKDGLGNQVTLYPHGGHLGNL